MPATFALIGFAGCDDEEDKSTWVNFLVANQSAEQVWDEGEYESEYLDDFVKEFSGTVKPGEVDTFAVAHYRGDRWRIRVSRTSDGFVLFEAAWRWGKNPPTEVPITIAP